MRVIESSSAAGGHLVEKGCSLDDLGTILATALKVIHSLENGLDLGAAALYGQCMELAKDRTPRQASPQAVPVRRGIGRGTPGPLGDSFSKHQASDGALVVVRRTRRRKSGIAAFWEEGRAVIAAPASLSVEDEDFWVPHMVEKLEGRVAGSGSKKRRPAAGDEALMQRAHVLSVQYLGGRAQAASVRWVSNQNSRWGSCTHSSATIRISHQVQGMPDWVVDYVLLHELAHLIHPNHSAAFWSELAGYPHLEQAKAFLEGAAFAAARNFRGIQEMHDVHSE